MCIGIGDDSIQVVDAGFEAFVCDRNRRFAQPVLVQEFVSGEEVGVPLARLGSTYALVPIAFRQANGEPFGSRPKTFRDMAIEHNTSLAPFESSDALGTALRRTAILSFDSLGMAGVGRIDFRIDADGRAWVFDTNESPPPVRGTSYATAMESLGFSVQEMLTVWLGICLLDFGLISGV
jgi:D-alanine-D-alanine ligase